MLKPFATIDDVNKIWRQLKAEEMERASKLLELVSDSLRMEADKVGKDLDKMIEAKPYFFKCRKIGNG